VFPGEYVGQYTVYETVRHLYSSFSETKPLLKDDSFMVNKKFFATDLEKAITHVRGTFREKNKIP
jgi:hypothetical protein